MPGHIYCRQRNSGEAEVIGGDDLFERFPPAEQPLPEVVLRRGVLLRRANVRRRRMLGGRANSGEAALVGGDVLSGCFPPAENHLTGEKPFPAHAQSGIRNSMNKVVV